MARSKKKPEYDDYDEDEFIEKVFAEEGVAKEPEKEYDFSSKVKLRLRISARYSATGSVTGKRYTWERAGTIVEVDEADAPDLLKKRLGQNACCGGSPDRLNVFEKLE